MPTNRVKRSFVLLPCTTLLLGAAPSFGQITSRASVSSAGVEGNDISSRWGKPVLDADGFLVAFDSIATNLVAGDGNGTTDVFVHDRRTGVTTRISVSTGGSQANDSSQDPDISSDGRFVAFDSSASNLVPGDLNGRRDVFVRDLQAGTTERVSVGAGGLEANGTCSAPAISADGRYVAFYSDATNLVSGDANGTRDIFVRDRLLGTTERASVSSAGVEGSGFSAPPDISADGRFVAFGSFASDLVLADTNATLDVFVRDRLAGSTERVSVDGAGVEGSGLSSGAKISGDGRYVAFFSDAPNLVAGDTNLSRDIFVRDRQAGTTVRVSVDSAGIEANGGSAGASVRGSATTPALSADGNLVAFDSDATNLVAGDSNAFTDVFIHDRRTGTTERVSVSSAAVQSNDSSADPDISAGGSAVTFMSMASNLVPGDTNSCGVFPLLGQCPDVFVHDRPVGPCFAGTVNAGGGPIADPLRINGSSGDARRIVSMGIGQPFELLLDAAPAGPNPGRYGLWGWNHVSLNPRDVVARGSRIGCTVNPIPIHPQASPQPFICLLGTGVPRQLCGPVNSPPSPPEAPWALRRPQGLLRPIVATLQAVLEDSGAANPTGFSVTNAVTLQVR